MENGSVAIEASFVMTMTILVVMALLAGAFYQHDRCVLTETAIEMELRGIAEPDETAFLTPIFRNRLERRLMMSSLLEAEVKKEGNYIIVSAAAEFHLKNFLPLKALTGNRGTYSCSDSARIPADAQELIRAEHGLIWRKK